MKVLKEQVKSESKVVAVVEIPEFETLQEAISNLGEAKCLSLVNTQNGTNIKNAARAEASGKPSKQKLRDQALAELVQNTSDMNELRSIMSDPTKRDEILDKRVAELEAQWQAQKEARASELEEQLKANGTLPAEAATA